MKINKLLWLLMVSGVILTACNGGSGSTSGAGNNSNGAIPANNNTSIDFAKAPQFTVPTVTSQPQQSGKTLQATAVAAACFQISSPSVNASAWWTSGSFNIKNCGSGNQAVNGLQVRISSSNYSLSSSSFSINSISGVLFPAPVYWAATNASVTSANASSGKAELLLTVATDKSGILSAGGLANVSFGYNSAGATPGAFTFSIDGSTPTLSGADELTIDATALKSVCSGSLACNIPVHLVGQNGQFDQVVSTITNANAISKFTVTVTSLNPGAYSLSIANKDLPTSVTFTSTNPVDILAGSVATDSLTFAYSPVISNGDVSYTIAKPAGITLASNTLAVMLLDANSGQVSGGSALATFASAFTMSNLPAGKYTLSSYGLADAQSGVYYDPLNLATTITAGKTTTLTSSMAKDALAPVAVNLQITGLAAAESAVVTLTDNLLGKQFIYNSFKIYNGANALKMLPGDAVTLNLTAPSKYNSVPATTYIVPAAGGAMSINFVQPSPDPVVSTTASYDYIAPFKDYNNKIILSVNKVAAAKSLTFTANFQQKAGWGICFGQSVDNLDFSTVAVGSNYATTIKAKDSAKTLNLTASCDIMGTDSGNALVLPGVVDPIVSAVKYTGIDDKVVALAISQPCAANGCKDPGNGYVNAGYYAQWAVWGRQYNPNSMPLNNINDILYAFIGFDPATGNVKTLDASADSWGLSATSRAMLQYPYLKAHLSFGGWTNNGVNTAPMFERLASSPASMQNFASQAVALMRKVGFSGIDIDWEWWSDYAVDAAPAQKQLALFKIIKAELDKASIQDGKKYMLSIATNVSPAKINAMQSKTNPNSVANFWSQVAGLVEHINIMSYDIHGSWDIGNASSFQAVWQLNSDNPYYAQHEDIASGIAAYELAAVPAKQLVVGLPLYARAMSIDSLGANKGLYATVKGNGFGDYEAGILDYKCLVNPIVDPINGCGSNNPVAGVKGLSFINSTTDSNGLFTKYSKTTSFQPWAYSATTFVSYDDVWSVTAKTQAVKAAGLAGIMFWELDGDATTPSLSLIQAVKNELNK